MSKVENGSKTIRQSSTPKIIESEKPIVGRVGIKRKTSNAKKVVNCQEADLLANAVCGSQYRSELYERIKACNMLEVFKRKLKICGLKGLSYSDSARILSSQLHVKLSGKELQKMLSFYPDIGMCYSFSKEEYILKASSVVITFSSANSNAFNIIDRVGDAGLGLLSNSYNSIGIDSEDSELSETESTISDIKREMHMLKLESSDIEPDEDMDGE